MTYFIDLGSGEVYVFFRRFVKFLESAHEESAVEKLSEKALSYKGSWPRACMLLSLAFKWRSLGSIAKLYILGLSGHLFPSPLNMGIGSVFPWAVTTVVNPTIQCISTMLLGDAFNVTTQDVLEFEFYCSK